MQASIAPPLMFGLATGVVAAVATVASGGGFLLAVAAYSLGGASGLVVSAVVRAAPHPDRVKDAAARAADRHWADATDVQAAAAAAGLATADATAPSRG
jgi:hypothetical protein